MLIDLILLRLASLVNDAKSRLIIIRNYSIFTTSDKRQSLGGTVDYLLGRYPLEYSGYSSLIPLNEQG